MTELTIETTALTRRFGSIKAVDDVSLQVPQGSIYGFLGPNGAGKTTTIRLLLGLLKPHHGCISLFQQSLPANRLALLRRVGSLVETPSLYPHLTGRQNLEVFRRLLDAETARIGWALDMMHLTDAADRRVGHYSLGMRQRLGLASALLGSPELLILDEPTNGLDPAGIREIRSLLVNLSQEYGITIFISSHLLAEVEQIATHLGIIQQGKLVFQDTLENLHAQMEHHVLIDVDEPQQAKAVLQRAGWTIHRKGSNQLAVAAHGNSDAAMINRELVQQGINVYRVNLERPTLEEMFLTLTASTTIQGGPRS